MNKEPNNSSLAAQVSDMIGRAQIQTTSTKNETNDLTSKFNSLTQAVASPSPRTLGDFFIKNQGSPDIEKPQMSQSILTRKSPDQAQNYEQTRPTSYTPQKKALVIRPQYKSLQQQQQPQIVRRLESTQIPQHHKETTQFAAVFDDSPQIQHRVRQVIKLIDSEETVSQNFDEKDQLKLSNLSINSNLSEQQEHIDPHPSHKSQSSSDIIVPMMLKLCHDARPDSFVLCTCFPRRATDKLLREYERIIQQKVAGRFSLKYSSASPAEVTITSLFDAIEFFVLIMGPTQKSCWETYYMSAAQDHSIQLCSSLVFADEEQNCSFHYALQSSFAQSLQTSFKPKVAFEDRINIQSLFLNHMLDDQTLNAISAIIMNHYDNIFIMDSQSYNSERVCESNISRILSERFIFSPICDHAHWFCMIYDSQENKYHFFDSLHTQLSILFKRKFLYMMDRRYHLNYPPQAGQKGFKKLAKVSRVNITSQANGVDCGYNMILVIIKIAQENCEVSDKIKTEQSAAWGVRFWFLCYFMQHCQLEEIEAFQINLDQEGSVLSID